MIDESISLNKIHRHIKKGTKNLLTDDVSNVC